MQYTKEIHDILMGGLVKGISIQDAIETLHTYVAREKMQLLVHSFANYVLAEAKRCYVPNNRTSLCNFALERLHIDGDTLIQKTHQAICEATASLPS